MNKKAARISDRPASALGRIESWVAESLTGSASGSGYEQQEWIEQLFSCGTQEEIRAVLHQRFGNKFDFWNGALSQNKPAPWKEQYVLLSLFNGHYHLMRIPVKEDSFDWQVPRYYPDEIGRFVREQYIYAHVKWLSDNEIKIMYCIEEGNRGDEDGFGVEPDIWILSALDRKGQLKYPFRFNK